jgi:hypothetical protein
MSARTLKIEATGDFFAGKVKPKIRLCGKWLEQAGFKPGERVELVMTEPGTLTLRAVAPLPENLLLSGQPT